MYAGKELNGRKHVMKAFDVFLNCFMLDAHISSDVYAAKNSDVFIDLSKKPIFLIFPHMWRDEVHI